MTSSHKPLIEFKLNLPCTIVINDINVDLITFHVNTTGERPYECKVCSKTFTDYSVVRKHLLMAHKMDKNNWKVHVSKEVQEPTEHYVSGGPGYQPRESSEEIRKKNKATVIPPAVSGGPTQISTVVSDVKSKSEPDQNSENSGAYDNKLQTENVKSTNYLPVTNTPLTGEVTTCTLTTFSELPPVFSSENSTENSQTIALIGQSTSTGLADNTYITTGYQGYISGQEATEAGETSLPFSNNTEFPNMSYEMVFSSFLKSNYKQQKELSDLASADRTDCQVGQSQQVYSFTPNVAIATVSAESVPNYTPGMNTLGRLPSYSEAFYNSSIFNQYHTDSVDQPEL